MEDSLEKALNRRKFLKISAQGAAIAGISGIAGSNIPEIIAAEISRSEDPAAWITSLIQEFTLKSPLNSLRNETNERAFDEPLVGFSRGDDPIYQQYKNIIGPYHWTPLEIFRLTFPDVRAHADELSVISWVHPLTESIKADLRKETRNPSEKWVRNRLYGEELNDAQRKYVSDVLTQSGHHAVAPTLSPGYQATFQANWSERHAAYVSGLGTFGLCDGLITPRGKSVRLGSVVARIQIDPTPRPYEDHHAYCLFYAKGVCGMCIKRCPAGAISKSGHDKWKCYSHKESTRQYANKNFNLKGEGAYGCGFCQTGVPCESGIPV